VPGVDPGALAAGRAVGGPRFCTRSRAHGLDRRPAPHRLRAGLAVATRRAARNPGRSHQQHAYPDVAARPAPCRGNIAPGTVSAYNRSVIQATERRRITDPETLRALVGLPSERAVRKQFAALDPHSRRFIDRSPFVLL